MQVKPNSIWFQDVTQLTHWQQLKKNRNAQALAAYERKLLGNRNAFQFLKPLTVEIVGYEPATNQVEVELKSEGRMQGTWMLDSSAIAQ